MKLPLSWLSDFVKIHDAPNELAFKLSSIGFEVEEIITYGNDIKNVVVGNISKIIKHENADKLVVCDVNIGHQKNIQIVTGATNVFVGAYVPVALDGAILPNNKTIKAGDIRGVASNGMMCSATELGISDDYYPHSKGGILLLPISKIGQDITTTLDLNDTIFDISVPANRPDCQSICGIAREIAAIYNKTINQPELSYFSDGGIDKIKPNIDKNVCSRYIATVLIDVTISPSPISIVNRLRKVGLRAIDNIVDITNYVLIEMGQPMHSFDYEYVKNGISVQKAKDGEKFVALNEKEYTLDSSTTIIKSDNVPVAIAGIMGGEYSGVKKSTNSVVLESAIFYRKDVRFTSSRLGLKSDSSSRFEKGICNISPMIGMQRFLHLIQKYSFGKVGVPTDINFENVANKIIKTDINHINALLGIKIPISKAKKILENLEFSVGISGNKMAIKVPLFREDIDSFADIAEEIIRFYGYDKLTTTMMDVSKHTKGEVGKKFDVLTKLRNILISRGFLECTSYSFVEQELTKRIGYDKDHNLVSQAITIKNPLSVQYNTMRTELVGNMLNTIALNLSRKNTDFLLFEIGRVYIANSIPLVQLPGEKERLCIAGVNKRADFYYLKAAIKNILDEFGIKYTYNTKSSEPYLNIYASMDFFVDGKNICSIGEVSPTILENFDISIKVVIASLDLEKILNNDIIVKKSTSIPKFPSVKRDFAIVVKEDTSVGIMIDCIKETLNNVCTDVELFDIYKGEQVKQGYKSVALSVLLQGEKTFTEDEINLCAKKVLDVLSEKFEATLR